MPDQVPARLPLIDRITVLTARLRGRDGVVAIGSAARAFSLVSQLVVLLVMSWMLPKNAFGEAMIVFTLYRLLGLGMGTGLGNLLLYHVGRAGGDAALDIRILRSVTLVGLATSGLVTLALALSAGPIAEAFQKPGLAGWLLHMSPMVLFGTMNFITAGSFDGRSQVTQSIILTEVAPNALRLLGLPLVARLALPDLAIAHVLWLAMALPWLWDLRRVVSGPPGLARLSAWDLRYAGWFTIHPIATQQLQGIDMLIVGALFSSTVAADYSLASRLATYFPFLQYILVRAFAPRAGDLHHRTEITALNAELAELKGQSIIMVYGLTGAIILGAPLGLRLFGDFSGALPILLLLALPAMVRSIFAGVDAMLKMTGRAGVSSAIALGSVALIVGLSYLAAPWLGIYALPVAMLASALIFNPIMTAIVGTSGIHILAPTDALWLLVPVTGILLALVMQNEWIAVACGGLPLLATAAVARWGRKRQ